MSTQVFPTASQLPGIDISISRVVKWDTIVQEAISGKETRIARRQFPRREIGLKFNFLRSSTLYLEIQTLEGFFNNRQGMYDSFLWQDPDDNSSTHQTIATTDGVNNFWQLVRPFGGFVEPVYAPNVVSNVFIDSTALTSTQWSITRWGTGSTLGPGVLVTSTFTPPASQSVICDLTYWFPVRFTVDDFTFDRFVNAIYENKKVTFTTII